MSTFYLLRGVPGVVRLPTFDRYFLKFLPNPYPQIQAKSYSFRGLSFHLESFRAQISSS